jgi:hypothetical protein
VPAIALVFIGKDMEPDTVTLDSYIVRTLMRDLVGHDHRPAAWLVYVWLAAEAQRANGPVEISYAGLAEETGLSRSAVQAAVAWLLRRKLLSAQHDSATATPRYTVLQPWVRKAKR